MLRSAVVGVLVGFIPGLGGSVVDWISYGVARQTVKGGEEFGNGDVRGVIAPESSNNAKEGGALIPTLLFGIPGSGTTAVLLSSFVVLGFAPGRDMLKEDGDLDITVLIIAALAIANVLGTLACLSLSRFVAKLATVRATRLVPFVLTIMLVGAYQSTKNWGDLLAMFVIGVLGWVMVHTKFPLPPLLIGFVLSEGAERNMFLANGSRQLRDLSTYGWILEPTVLGIGIVAVLLAGFGYRANKRTAASTKKLQTELGSDAGNDGEEVEQGSEAFDNVLPNLVFLGLLASGFIYFGVEALGFVGKAAPFPRTIAFAGLLITVVEAASYVLAVRASRAVLGGGKFFDPGPTPFGRSLRSVLRYVIWICLLYIGIWLCSIPIAVTVFLVVFLIVEGEMSWWRAVLSGVLMLIFLVSLEDIMSLRWPDGSLFELPEFVEDWFPEKIPLLNRLA